MKISQVKTKFLGCVMLLIACTNICKADNGVKIEYLGTNNTLVRVTTPGRYIILPVQESNEEAAVNVVVNGKTEKTISVRLAKSKVDYTVPLNIEKFAGKDVVLNIVTSQGRSSVRETKDDACWKDICVSDSYDTSNREKFRPLYHHTPLYGWMNDPNGMFYKDGVWHLAFQWNPYGSKWQNLSWGQSTSTDLIHWTMQPDAVLEPDGLGMIFSGSSAIDTANSAGFGKDAVLAMYTSAAVNQIQSLAWSEDGGYTYKTYSGNPTLTLESEARDPNMFWNEANKEWVLILAHALEHEMLIFTSPDMKTWTLQDRFGQGLGAQGGVWECPDLFELPVAGTDKKKWVLICNLNPGGISGGSATQYFIGDFDGKKFTPDLGSDGNVPTKWLDYGKDHYATVSFSGAPDGRRTVIGWMSNWQYAPEVPTMQFRSANTLPREVGLFVGEDGQVYASSTPSPEINGLRGKVVAAAKNVRIGNKVKTYALPTTNDGACEIEADFDAQKADSITMILSNAKGEEVVMTYKPSTNCLSFDRSRSGIVEFSMAFPAVTYAPTHSKGGRLSVRIFIDRSSIEVFGKDGKFVMTNLVFPNLPYSSLRVEAGRSKAKLANLKVYSIKI